MANLLVNLRLGDKLLKEIDEIVASETYESRTEFIRETLRKKVEETRAGKASNANAGEKHSHESLKSHGVY